MKKYSLLAASLVVGVFLGACGGSKVVNIPGVGSAKVNGSNVTISSGGHSLAEGTKLPSSFPKAVPLPQGYRVLGVINGSNAASGTSSASTYFEVVVAVTGAPQSAASAYTTQLKSGGFTISSSGGSSATYAVIAKSGQWSVEAVFGSSGGYQSQLKSGETGITLTVTSA